MSAIKIRNATSMMLDNNCKYICCAGSSANRLEEYADDAIVFVMEEDSQLWSPTTSHKTLEECLYYALFHASIENVELKTIMVVDCDNKIMDDVAMCITRFSERHFISNFKAMKRKL